MLKIFIEEEYGYAYHTWNFPGSVEELIAEWKAGRIPHVGYVFGKEFRGTCEPVETPEFEPYPGVSDEEYLANPDKYPDKEEDLQELCRMWEVFLSRYDAECHIHEEDDSSLKIGNQRIPWTAAVDHGSVQSDLIRRVLEKE